MSKIAVATAAASQGATDVAASGKQDDIKGDAPGGDFADVLDSKQGSIGSQSNEADAAQAKAPQNAGNFGTAMATSAQIITQAAPRCCRVGR